MNAKASAGNVIVMQCVRQAEDTEFVSVFTALKEMDGVAKVLCSLVDYGNYK